MQFQNHIRDIANQNSFQQSPPQNQYSEIMQQQIPSQLQSQQKYQYSVSQQNWSAPLSQFSNSFSVFSEKKRPGDLQTFVKIKSHLEYQQAFSQFKSYIQIKKIHSNQTTLKKTLSEKNKQNTNPEQFFYSSQIPQNCTFIVTVKSLSNGRCNIEVYNLFGFVIAYFNSLKTCKKFAKIYKLISKLAMPCLLIIVDEIPNSQFQYNYLKKLKDLCQNYLYLFTDFTDSSLKINSSIHPVLLGQLLQIDDNQIVQRVGKKLYYFSKVFTNDHLQSFYKVDSLLETIEKSRQELFAQLNIVKSEEEKNLTFDAMIINIAKSYVYKSEDILNKILQIFQMNQQKIVDSNEEIKFGQKQWHIPQAMKSCRDCLYCSKFGKFLKKKSKYRCEACSAIQKRQIPLCVVCFKNFHRRQKIKGQLLRSAGGKSKKIKKQKVSQKDRSKQKFQNKAQEHNQIEKALNKKDGQIQQFAGFNSHSDQSAQINRGPSENRTLTQPSWSQYKKKQADLLKQKQKLEILKQFQELAEIKRQIFREINKLKEEQKYEVMKEALQIFLSRIIIASNQLEQKVRHMNLGPIQK